MITFLITILVLVVSYPIVLSYQSPSRVFELPLMASFVVGGYLLPQMVALSYDYLLPEFALERSIIMTILCLSATYYGYFQKGVTKYFTEWSFSYAKLLHGAYFMTISGYFFFYKVSTLASEVSLETGGQWSGVITIYMLFAGLLTEGLALSVLLYLYKPNGSALICTLIGLSIYAERILIQGRRSAMAEIFLIILLGFWFQRKWAPPRNIVLIALFGGVLIVNSIGDYRSTMLQNDNTTYSGAGIDAISQIDFVGNFKKTFTEGGHDWRNAVYLMYISEENMRFDFGLSLWNILVHRYFPAQFFGSELKAALKVNTADAMLGSQNYAMNTGSMLTGFGDAFSSFWYFGFIKFLLIGYLMGLWFRSGLQGNLVFQLVSMLMGFQAITIFPSSTNNFFVYIPFMFATLYPIMIYARK